MTSYGLLKIICLCAIFNTAAGVVEFFLKHRFFVDIFPRSMLATMIENNPTLAQLLPNPGDFRNGLFRASSTFVTALSFGEFEIIVIPIGLFFLLHREKLLERVLGGMVAVGGIVGIFASGSRGGFVGVIVSRCRVCCFLLDWQSNEHQDESSLSNFCSDRHYRRRLCHRIAHGLSQPSRYGARRRGPGE